MQRHGAPAGPLPAPARPARPLPDRGDAGRDRGPVRRSSASSSTSPRAPPSSSTRGWSTSTGSSRSPARARPEGRRLLMRRPSGFDLHSVRDYQQGESLRRVHWPTTARRGHLMVEGARGLAPRRDRRPARRGRGRRRRRAARLELRARRPRGRVGREVPRRPRPPRGARRQLPASDLPARPLVRRRLAPGTRDPRRRRAGRAHARRQSPGGRSRAGLAGDRADRRDLRALAPARRAPRPQGDGASRGDARLRGRRELCEGRRRDARPRSARRSSASSARASRSSSSATATTSPPSCPQGSSGPLVRRIALVGARRSRRQRLLAPPRDASASPGATGCRCSCSRSCRSPRSPSPGRSSSSRPSWRCRPF